jgi:hypothetical protein
MISIHRVLMVAALAVLSMTALHAQQTVSPVARHCEFTKRLLALSEAEWKERLVATEASVGNRQQLEDVLSAISGRHAQMRTALFLANNTTPVEHGRFAAGNKDEIETYLKEHATLSTELAAIKKRIAASIERCERVMAAAAGVRP